MQYISMWKIESQAGRISRYLSLNPKPGMDNIIPVMLTPRNSSGLINTACTTSLVINLQQYLFYVPMSCL